MNHEPEVKATDMEEDMIKRVKEIAINAVKEYKQEKQIAHYIKYEFDKIDGYGWNCIVGRNFGSHIIHQTKKYIFFKINELCLLLWKA
ncbi:cytoplasmic dynein light chain 2 (macronuclear) [Tetrahymena thermophila SB210]|uniref:Dynein light chain 8d n=2 Tax=Tetrahymena thermophila TaxID=5911 RepID=DYL8D_TETTS|nr:cytoplasmic dynein light chain 2 [Tetrahymena thermophila SB210]6ZYW_M Chain M, Dynein light chain [Tetrahymena thermophila SB210]6ZYX_M Chain M, Dynein light chain [Tetrahymena thermophila CU428]7K58_M Chain M, Dynein light chain [Tetrahymena thermophila]7K5B_M Chain M, Dynein light chain [Tetrahymena thermophila]7KEK_M Chain M, Dynein light chain LC8_3a [Tetrahymena thermophila]7MOQ_M Chain M, Dynein light chain [Tetrahymena thermophila CU428]8BWY_M Chain M, Dynein light chain [Chlamydo|eukprot:XP_001025674.2 cytoplasmic dynein light chain 2 [Tetrahymena thermophila SB210]